MHLNHNLPSSGGNPAVTLFLFNAPFAACFNTSLLLQMFLTFGLGSQKAVIFQTLANSCFGISPPPEELMEQTKKGRRQCTKHVSLKNSRTRTS